MSNIDYRVTFYLYVKLPVEGTDELTQSDPNMLCSKIFRTSVIMCPMHIGQINNNKESKTRFGNYKISKNTTFSIF